MVASDTAVRPRTSAGTRNQRLRLATGLVLFAFVTAHLINHALGLVSLDAMEAMRDVRVAITRSIPGTVILVGAGIVHMVLGILKFITRRTWRISTPELIQLSFGLLIPLLLIRHIIGTRVVHELYGVDDNYLYALWAMWPAEAWRQGLLILLVWTHGCIGLDHWLSLKPWYAKAKPWAIGVAVLLPALAFAGFSAGGRNVRFETEFESPLTDEQYLSAVWLMDLALYGYLALLVLMVSLRLVRRLRERFLPKVRIEYAGGPTVTVPHGFTILEVSRMHRIPHASVCGGRARCSTCRVRVLSGLEEQPLPHEAEARVLTRVGATGNVRLACQLRPVGDIKVATLLPAKAGEINTGDFQDRFFWGVEQVVTVMFCDIRGFTRMSEQKLPFDVVFLLNQYLSRMSEVIEDAGGFVDKFMGDGVMAIFGIDSGEREGALAALQAAKAMGGVLEALNQSLREEVPQRLRIGIGINTGPAILGRIGAAGKRGAGQHITALGDTVNTASRLETACKDRGVELMVALRTLQAAGLEPVEGFRTSVDLRGKTEPLTAFALPRALDVPEAWVPAAAREPTPEPAEPEPVPA